MTNMKIRQAIARHRLKYYEVAEACGISPYTLSIWLRKEFTLEKEQKIMKDIDDLVKQYEQE